MKFRFLKFHPRNPYWKSSCHAFRFFRIHAWQPPKSNCRAFRFFNIHARLPCMQTRHCFIPSISILICGISVDRSNVNLCFLESPLVNKLRNWLFKTKYLSALLMTLVSFLWNGATAIISHLLVLTYEKNLLQFVRLFTEKSLKTKFCMFLCILFVTQQQLLERYSSLVFN